MDKLDHEAIHELLSALGDHLAAGGHSVAIVVVGGSTLAARGWVDRVTTDVDVIARGRREAGTMVLVSPDPLPEELSLAVARVARDYGLPDDWLNTTVGKQWDFGLPEGFPEEIDWVDFGGLEVGFAGRQSLIALKLFAAVDEGPESIHTQDLLALSPTESELSAAASWVRTQDATEAFRVLLSGVIEHVRKRS